MTILGEQIIGWRTSAGTHGEIRAVEAATGASMEPAFGGSSLDDLDRACALADAAFDTYRAQAPAERAAFLDAVADEVMALGDELVVRCVAETGLPRSRVEGERARTVGQLRMFADVVRDGAFLDARIDRSLPERKPLPRPDIRLLNVPLGPVAVFGASNFPLAFSVAGGDTASALAAGCPVVVKAHSAHPGTSELVGRAVAKAAHARGMPEGVFSLLFGAKREIGQRLVADPRIMAVGFTGSRTAGTMLMQIAAARPEPIPVYAEMSSVNPVLLFPGALKERGAAIGSAFVASLTLGAGQFCTNPGLVLAVEGSGLEAFIESAAASVRATPGAVMLTPGIRRAYCEGISALAAHAAVTMLAEGAARGACEGRAMLFAVGADAFLADAALREEVFGATSLVVRCRDVAQMEGIVRSLEGQLTAALHLTPADYPAVRALLPLLERKVGRILVNGFGTGVEVCHAMVHGGPYPATSDGRSTSVGAKAIERFLRPVCYQDMPELLLPDALADENELGLWRREDGALAPQASS